MTHRNQIQALADTVLPCGGAVVLLQAPRGAGQTIAARMLWERLGGVPFRAPHHTASQAGVIAELALAAGGILYLDDWQEHRASTLQALWSTWSRMAPSVRPLVVLGWHPDHDTRLVSSAAVWGHLVKITERMPGVDYHLVWGFGDD